MSEPIINPMWFYFVDVIRDLEVVLFSIGLVTGVVCLFFIIAQTIEVKDAWDDESRAKEWKLLKRFIKLCAIPIVCFVLVVLIPSKDTMYEMMIAKYITHENLSISVEAVKSAVDYIVEAFKAVK